MAFLITSIVTRSCLRQLEDSFVALSISVNNQQVRYVQRPKPRLRNPVWFVGKQRKFNDEFVTPENNEFLKEVVQDEENTQISQMENNVKLPIMPWSPKLRRTGLIAKKIGIYPMWLKNGKKVSTTLLQVLDNHVIRSYKPNEYEPARPRPTRVQTKKHCLLVGAETGDPSSFTREYCGLFKDSGVMPKNHLARFFVSPQATLQPGTPLNVHHFKVGQFVDIRGKTIDRGFQGVMKRWGFKGMPATHGVTKTHRRGGNIGGGGEKGRVWPGTKMPGHMGNRYRILRGVRILRINTKHNVLYVLGQNIAGETNSIVTIYDTILPFKRSKVGLIFPTCLEVDEDLPENIYAEDVRQFGDPNIEYNEK